MRQASTRPAPQVWEIVSQGKNGLDRRQFASALSVIALAQQSGGYIDRGKAVKVISGLAPPPPPPKMDGLEVPGAAEPAKAPVGMAYSPAPVRPRRSKAHAPRLACSPPITPAGPPLRLAPAPPA